MKPRDYLNNLGIYNDHRLLQLYGRKGQDVFVYYHPSDKMRSGRTLVSSPSHKTDPRAYWLDNGAKSFFGNRAESMPKALAWASETYQIDEWVPSPFGGGAKVPAYVMKVVKDKMKGAE